MYYYAYYFRFNPTETKAREWKEKGKV